MNRLGAVLQHLRKISAKEDSCKLRDQELLQCFVSHRDEAAFEVLLARHGPMVLNVCRRVLPEQHLVEDAFQATFLVLVRKASSIGKRELLTNWLYGVAYRTAARAKVEAAKRRARESAVVCKQASDPLAEISARELLAVLDEELSALPAQYRGPLVLCFLEGKTQAEVARQFGWSLATLARRLERGREILRARLTRRGLALPALVPLMLCYGTASANVPPSLTASTVAAAALTVGGATPTAAVISPNVIALTEGVLKTMLFTKLKAVMATLLLAGMLGAGIGTALFTSRTQAQPPAKGASSPVATAPSDDSAKDAKELEGEWQAVDVEKDGKKVKPDDMKDLRIVFKGDELIVKSAKGEGKERKSKFTLIPGKSPKEIDVSALEGQEKGQTVAAIYSLEKGQLKLCMPYFKDLGKRPKEFTTQADDGRMLFVLKRVKSATNGEQAPKDAKTDKTEFSSIRDEWERVAIGYVREGRLAPGEAAPPKPVPPLVGKERAAADQRLAVQCLQLADKHPDTWEALAALYLAASRAPDLDAGKQALRRLSKRMSSIELGDFERAVKSSRVESQSSKHVFEEIAPMIIKRIKQSPEQPQNAVLLTKICTALGFDSQTKTPPQHFTEAADLIGAGYANSPDIYNFCEILGGGIYASPHWAGGFDRHLQTILAKNQNRWVRCTASLARASVAQLSINRQAEAEKLYERFLADFDGKTQYWAQNVEQMVIDSARQRLTAMRFAPIGRPAPEILGIDLKGKPMRLSDYRGKVVVVSFWATWCFPCMKLIPHERELAARLTDKPFAIIGINGDTNGNAIQKALDKHKITWRSFQDKRPGTKSISEEWNALYPTVFLIDHKGVFRQRWTGAPPIDVLNRMVDELVAEAVDKKNK